MVLVADHCSAPVEEPGKEAFDLPSTAVSAQGPAILSGLSGPVAAMGTDELDPPFGKRGAELVAVVGAIGGHTFGLERAAADRTLSKGHFIGSGAEGPYGDRKTMSVCEGHDLGAFTSLSRSNITPPFLALAKVPSKKHSVISIFPLVAQVLGKPDSTLSHTPALHH